MDEKLTALLTMLDKETIADGGADRALFHLLSEFKEVLPSLDNRFHKAFRQTDVTPSGRIDAAIWQLLGNSSLFWRCFEKVQGEKKLPNVELTGAP